MKKEFRVYYGNSFATQDQLDAIEEIVVEQEIGRIWEARIKIPIFFNEDGSWEGEDSPAYEENARVRIEARIGEGIFIPLIDGCIVNQEPGLSAYPGDSTLTLTIYDDSSLLHREVSSESFADEPDSKIAASLFISAGFGGLVEVDAVSKPSNSNVIVQRRGTQMQLLRAMMARHRGFYAYVLPGVVPGKSDCYFKQLPTSPDPSLPKLVLTGAKRNISRFGIRRLSNRAAVHEAALLDMDDMTITAASANSAEVEPPEGEGATRIRRPDMRVRRLIPGVCDHVNIQEAVDSAALASSFTIQADGEVLPDCYGGILSPYRMVEVNVSNSRFSGNYVIFKVTHTLGVSEYTQSFSVCRNAVSPAADVAGGSAPAAAAAVAGSVAVSFNIQMDIF